MAKSYHFDVGKSQENAALDLLKSIDGKTLREQRLALINNVEQFSERLNEIDGLIGLTDAIADFLADQLGDSSALISEDKNDG